MAQPPANRTMDLQSVPQLSPSRAGPLPWFQAPVAISLSTSTVITVTALTRCAVDDTVIIHIHLSSSIYIRVLSRHGFHSFYGRGRTGPGFSVSNAYGHPFVNCHYASAMQPSVFPQTANFSGWCLARVLRVTSPLVVVYLPLPGVDRVRQFSDTKGIVLPLFPLGMYGLRPRAACLHVPSFLYFTRFNLFFTRRYGGRSRPQQSIRTQ